MKIKIEYGQSLFDIALIYTGNAHNAVYIACYNNISLTSNLEGIQIYLPPGMETSKRVVTRYKNKKLNPATGTY